MLAGGRETKQKQQQTNDDDKILEVRKEKVKW